MADQTIQGAPSPTSHGWSLADADGDYTIKWHDILKTHSGKCACRNAQLPCTELCSCHECENVTSEEIVADGDNESEAETD